MTEGDAPDGGADKAKKDGPGGGGADGGSGRDMSLFEGPARWIEAETEVRTTLKWLLSGLGGAATLLFGAGPLLTGFEYETSWTPEQRAAVALALVAVGITGVIHVARRVLEALSPVELTVASLNAPGSSWSARVEAAPALWLPEGVADLDTFQHRLRALATQAKRRRLAVDDLEAELAEGGTKTHVADVTERLGNMRRLSQVTDENLATFQRARDVLLAQATHDAASKQARFGADVAVAVVAVVVCAAAYMFVVAGKEPEAAKPSTAFPAVLVDVDAGFIDGAGLSECAGTVSLGGEGERSGIPVVVTAQTEETVTFDVLAVAGCPAITATLPTESATVVKSKPLTIKLPE